MRGIVLSIIAIVWLNPANGQGLEEWKQYITEDSTIKSDDNTYLINASELLMNESSQMKILRKLDNQNYIVRLISVSELDEFSNVNHMWKVDLKEDSNNSQFYIVTSDSFNPSDLSDFEIIKEFPSVNTYLIEGSTEQIVNSLKGNAAVLHISNRVNRAAVESRVIDMNLNPNRINKIHHFFPELNGNTETISIQENQYDKTDIDLLSRSIDTGLESNEVDNHATEMATIIAGNGNSFVTGRGVANELTISSSSFEDVMPDSDESYTTFDIITQNHSYGTPADTSHYGVEARAFDLSAFNNKNLLHVFSSGNEGNAIPAGGRYEGIDGYANLTGNYKMSKNSLVIGSVDTVGAVPGFVSRGPAYDGRVKPELVAYSVVGSSNSAALVSGISALLQQQYREVESADMPSALVKALLINGANDVGNNGPDYLTGYGNVNAWSSLLMLKESQYFEGAVGQTDITSFSLDVPDGAVNLKVTLCWTDPAANVNDFTALVNNLDLRLIDNVTMEETLPWVLDGSPDKEKLSKEAVQGVDNLNNVEQVTIDSPSSNYSIEVEGAAVDGTQEFYIAWQYELENAFEWDYPTGSDNMPYNGESGSYFRWNTTRFGTGELSYTVDNMNWIVLDSEIDLSEEYWRWNKPPVINGVVKARMTIGADVYETDYFTVSTPPSATVGFNCADSLMLRWTGSPNAISYTVYNLEDDLLKPFDVVTDTFLIIESKNLISSLRFSIEPNIQTDKNLIRTPSFDYTLQGVECYVFSFFQTVALDTGIYLNLSLGTTYGIEEIIFERNEMSSFVEIESVRNFASDEYIFLDENPNQGYNEHRAIIKFINGEQLTLSAGTSFYLTEIPVIVFPNPIESGDDLNIITKQFVQNTSTLQLIDNLGAIVHEQTIRSTQDQVSTTNLRSGIYQYRFFADDKVYSGRILIR